MAGVGRHVGWCACALLLMLLPAARSEPKPVVEPVCSVDMVLVIDASGSICGDRYEKTCPDWQRLKQFVINVIETIDQDEDSRNHRFAVVVYGNKARVEFELKTYTEVEKAVQHIRDIEYKPARQTNTADGLKTALEVISRNDRPNSPNVVVVITDGKSTDREATLKAAAALADAKVRVIAIGATDNVVLAELKGMSSAPHIANQDYFEVPNIGQLSSIITDVVITTCGPEVIELNDNICPIDLVIVYDTSGSICNNEYVVTCDDWRRLKTFMMKLVERVDPLRKGAEDRFGLVAYGHVGETKLSLTADRQAVIASMKALTYTPYQNTNAPDGLARALEIFTASGRPNTPRLTVIVTDGYSTIGGDVLAAARRLRDTGVRVITVGITDKIRLAELKGMATAPRLFEEDYFLVPNAETLTGVISKVAAQACKAKGKATGPVDEPERLQLEDRLLDRLLKALGKGQ